MKSSLLSEIQTIIQQEMIKIEFQPIVSLKLKKAVGVEALSRGIHPVTNEIIPPVKLFENAAKCGMTLELDRLCRRSAMREFVKFKNSDEMVLFLNFDPAVLDINTTLHEKSWTVKYADDAGLDYNNIAVEITESQIENNYKLEQITEKYSSIGMFVVLDDFGALHSNLNRLVISRPDIIKIDKQLINNVSESYYQQSIIKSIIDLAKKIGSLTLAEGVETKQDVLKCHELGADLFQGFYFARPQGIEDMESIEFGPVMDMISYEIKEYMSANIEIKKSQHAKFENIFDKILAFLTKCNECCFEKRLEESVRMNDDIECIYVLDKDGIQIGDTVCRLDLQFADNNLFHPSKAGTDHSLKEYFYYISSLNLTSYYTDPYISLATGILCRTMAKKFECDGKLHVLCIDFIDKKSCQIF
ncbi:diguanylate phosphodiesterase [Denitrovibrio acetiphilus DSM 12809]|uniref:Diguanylate phosphodiesterase n=1 Tax=Denitrovibrio acetiphilus (strain DSM 12809 / NBRC 114555 / N2460) TaxID=522772 RepID=D4H0I5_DENA2|nr:EAL domain-containing protein [Denitrovibrio acetiphilus]ADD68498.1 diguanylate phosphodiesterase [Denitrovibrio acetiphilus DSM 12809]